MWQSGKRDGEENEGREGWEGEGLIGGGELEGKGERKEKEWNEG